MTTNTKIGKRDTDKVAFAILIIMTIMELSITKLLAGIIPVFNLPYNHPAICVLYVLMIAAIFVLVVGPRLIGKNGINWDFVKEYKVLIMMLGLLLVSILLTDVVTIVKGQLRIANIFIHNLDYLYAFLALPITILLNEKKVSFTRLADTVIGLTVVSMTMRLFAVIYYAITEVEILCLTRESALEQWVRNGRIRVMAPCLLIMCVLLACYSFFTTKTLWKKVMYAAATLYCFFFAFYVWQSRAGLMVMAGGVAVIVLFRPMTKKLRYILWGGCAVAVIAFMALGGLNKIMASFSIDDNAIYGGENRGHLYAYQLFGGRFLKSFVLGEGLTETLAEWFPNGRAMWMCDAGPFYSLVPMGMLIGIFLIAMLVRGLYLFIKNRNNVAGCLILSITLTFLVNDFVADFFFTPLAFIVPFFWGIAEAIGYTYMKDEIRSEVG